MKHANVFSPLSTLVLLNHNDSNLSCQPHSNVIIDNSEQCNNFFDLCTCEITHTWCQNKTYNATSWWSNKLW
jgi:hypothetical protein